MKTLMLMLLLSAFLMGQVTMVQAATCDQYPGDTWIYGGINTRVKPNVLIILDTSGSMNDQIPTYDPGKTYAPTSACTPRRGTSTDCLPNQVYLLSSNKKYWEMSFDLKSVTTSCNNKNPLNLLSENGYYIGGLTDSGGCDSRGSDTYALGNWINWKSSGESELIPKIEVARNVVKEFISNTGNSSIKVNFGVMVYNNGDGTLQQSQGARFLSTSTEGSTYVSTIKDMDAIFSGTTTNREALLASITAVTAQGYTPLAESLYEAGQYFKGSTSGFGNSVGLSGSPAKYTSPIMATCQKNYIIFITDGMSTSDNSPVLKTVCPANNPNCGGDFDGDGRESGNLLDSLDDVAKYLYDIDLLQDDTAVGREYTIGKQLVSTYTIGFGEVGSDEAAVDLLKRAADNNHGHGASFLARNQSQLSKALNEILSNIPSVDTSFVAPVVPTSSINRTYSSDRLYMGFFKPVNQNFWRGNLKKYGLNASYTIVDKNGVPAISTSGGFKADSTSYWSTIADGASVDKGGAGSMMLTIDPTTRKIYTYIEGASLDLTNAVNDFKNVSAAKLGVPDAERDQLIKYIQGMDAYKNSTDKREWVMGDVLHSRPATVSYNRYTPDKESSCADNITMHYLGANDGMLHAIKDCDGSEAWAFIPPDMLPNLKEIPGKIHTYGVDATPSVFVYDLNKDGKIDTVKDKDKVILLFGMRRGGGAASGTAKGAYFVLDVSTPNAPKYIGKIGRETGFSEMGESWGEPRITRIKIGSEIKIAAFIAGGYDNVNEDSRYGATQSFSGDGLVSLSDSGSGPIQSAGSSIPKNPSGRAIYLVELATLAKLWSVVPVAENGFSYGFTGDVAIVDTINSGFPDRLYAVDLGGNVWRFDIGGSIVSKWSGNKIFNLNPGSGGAGDTGRKFFNKPSVTLELASTSPTRGVDAMVFLGSGDREHPLNTSVVDRFYGLRDRGQITPIGEAGIKDVTSDLLQDPDASIKDVNTILSNLKASTNYGWYIKLNERPGEKVLAPATVFSKVAYFTTYVPGGNSSTSNTSLTLLPGTKSLIIEKGLNIIPKQQVFIENGAKRMTGTVTTYNSTSGLLEVSIATVVGTGTIASWQVSWGDPCSPSIGTSRLYAVNYATGEAVYNFDTSNDTRSFSNTRARSGNTLLLQTDRSRALGLGIASALTVMIGTDGTVKAVVGPGGPGPGPAPTLDLKKEGSIVPLYWRRK